MPTYLIVGGWLQAAGSFLGQTVLPILCALLLLMLVMLGKARHNVVKETAYVEQQVSCQGCLHLKLNDSLDVADKLSQYEPDFRSLDFLVTGCP
jgi:hypothetical protein